MSTIHFASSEINTIGVEIEVALVDAETFALTSACPGILERMPAEYKDSIKPELMQCYIEANSKVCRNVAEAEADLRAKFLAIQTAADELGCHAYWSGTHPFSLWSDQRITPNERYRKLVQSLQETARQLVTFGLHVHVGVDSGDKAIMICDRMLRHLPTLLALSANSPFWEGNVTGLQSWRSRVMDGLPTAGLPPMMRNWSEYVWLVNHLVSTGFIETIREIWWDLRPHHNFGTVEIRICDVPGTLEDAMAIAALTHSLVKALSDEIDAGTYQHDCHPMMVRQNKWRAARYGLDAQLVDSSTYELQSARQAVRDLTELVRPAAEELGCDNELDRVLTMTEKPGWSQHQLDLLEKTGDPAEVVRKMIELSRL
jgi:glutamate---cysteine ligase / carboxylate-amine ligase